MNIEPLPQPWNEESEAGIKRLIEERDRARELAGKKTAEAEDSLVRAVLAERENARLRTVASEIMEALEGVLPYLEEDPDDDDDYNERIRAAHSVVAKVRVATP